MITMATTPTHTHHPPEEHTMPTIITTQSGRTATLPDTLDVDRVAGLDEEGRIVVDDFDARNGEIRTVTYAGGITATEAPFMFGLTLCCNASDKGTEHGVVCRGCFGTKRNADEGNYLFMSRDRSFPGLDPIVSHT